MGGTHVAVIEKRRSVPDLEGLDPSLLPLLRSMLAPDPADRPESAVAVANWLRSHLAGRPATVLPAPGGRGVRIAIRTCTADGCRQGDRRTDSGAARQRRGGGHAAGAALRDGLGGGSRGARADRRGRRGLSRRPVRPEGGRRGRGYAVCACAGARARSRAGSRAEAVRRTVEPEATAGKGDALPG